jgi:hypothetical protein
MASVDLQTVVSLAPSACYAQLSDFAARPSLDPTIVELAPPPESIVEGARFSGRGTATGEERGFDGIITALEPDRFLALACTFSNGARLHEQWRLSATPSGTLLNYHAELQLPAGVFGRLLDRLVVGSGFRRQREAVLVRLKSALESSAQG